jgi:hypothetical protein
MKKYIQIFAVVLLSAFSLHAGYTLNEAVTKGYINFSANSASGYQLVKAVVQNKLSVAVDIDFSKSWLVQDNDTQRVGLVNETSTKAYYLRLAANTTYTLYFNSYCLDHNRHSPVTGIAFVWIYEIPSQFCDIINALRNNSGQYFMWGITDGSGLLVQPWKAADPRPPVGGPIVTSSGVVLRGNVSWATSGAYINLKADKIQNLSNLSTTGSLRLRVWATRFQYTGGTINGYILGSRSLSPLPPNNYYANISGNVPYTRPPTGSYYTTMTIEEYTNSGWVIRDYINFPGLSRF